MKEMKLTLKEINIDDAEVVELIVNPGIKKLIITNCPKNPLKNFEALHVEAVHIKCVVSNEFR